MTTHISIDSKSIEYDVIEIQSRSMSDPTFSDIDFKNKMAWVWTTLKDTLVSDFWFSNLWFLGETVVQMKGTK